VIGELHRRHRSVEFRKFLDTIESQVPVGLDARDVRFEEISQDRFKRTSVKQYTCPSSLPLSSKNGLS
jgi:hypothetical protein